MMLKVAADAVVILHLGFILFVALGGFLMLWWPRVTWLHVPCVVWGALIEFEGWICPLTPIENILRDMGSGSGYSGGFIDHYLMPVVYPDGLTRETQLAFAVAVIVLNACVYGTVLLLHGSNRGGKDG